MARAAVPSTLLPTAEPMLEAEHGSPATKPAGPHVAVVVLRYHVAVPILRRWVTGPIKPALSAWEW
jgi:hypothetical protein